MTSTTLDLRAANRREAPVPASRWASLLRRITRYSEAIGGVLRMPAPGVPEAAAQLLRLAEAYEATQPSYAADLRAAASMGERQRGQAD